MNNAIPKAAKASNRLRYANIFIFSLAITIPMYGTLRICRENERILNWKTHFAASISPLTSILFTRYQLPAVSDSRRMIAVRMKNTVMLMQNTFLSSSMPLRSIS